MRTYNSFVTEKINKKFAPKNLTSIDALKRGIQTQAEIDAAADAAKDINKSGKLGKVTPEVKNELKKIKNRFFTDKPDSETLKVKPTECVFFDILFDSSNYVRFYFCLLWCNLQSF